MKLILSPLIRQYALVVTVNLAVLTTGMSLGWSSPVLVKLRNSTETPLSRPITEEEGSWIVSAGYLCALFTNLLGGMLLDVIGRKYCILLPSIPKLFMAILLIFAKEVWVVILSRAIMNAADCFIFASVPIYASEIASKEQRGALGTFLQLFSSLGVVTSLSIGPFLSYSTFSIVFTSVIALTTVPLFFIPDTPFYLYSKGRTDDAMKVLSLVRGSEIVAKEEIEDYKASTNSKEENIDKKALLKNKTFLKGLWIGLILVVGSQLTGFNAISFYLQTILESTNTSVMPEIASVVIGMIQVIASFCTTMVMNKFGRRMILLTTLIGLLIGMLGLGTFFQIRASEDYEVTGFMNYLPIMSLVLVIYCYSVGIGSLMWVVTAELFASPARALGVTINLSSSIALIFLTTKYFASMTSAMGPAATYWFFSSMCVLVFVLIAIFLPETKGKTFSEIQIVLGDNTNTYNVNEKDIQNGDHKF